MLSKELMTYQDRLFWIYRKIKQDQVNETNIQELKEHDIKTKNPTR